MVTDRRRFAEPAAGEVIAPAEWRALEAAIKGGIGALQLREKDLDGRPLLERARRLSDACRAAPARLLVNDRIDVALAASADGVHLPGDGFPIAVARELIGSGGLIGRSIHGVDELTACEGADYAVFGPVFETPSKRAYGAPQGLSRLAEVVRASPVPIFAIGGITLERVPAVLECGATGIAVIGAILDADDPSAAARAFAQALV